MGQRWVGGAEVIDEGISWATRTVQRSFRLSRWQSSDEIFKFGRANRMDGEGHSNASAMKGTVMTAIRETQEGKRLSENPSSWTRWGPYVSNREWGTVREDYSAGGYAWDAFPHDQARSRAYRWGEDGIAGICDDRQHLCFALALWNGEDDILKERLFGLTNGEGNHGEDVKEYSFYLDNTPTHSYMKCLYKYPQTKFPYANLVWENGRRQADPSNPEYELLDTGIFRENRYFDILIEYAKSSPEDILIQISVTNRGPANKVLHLLPTLWFRNTWSWQQGSPKPSLSTARSPSSACTIIEATGLGGESDKYWLYCERPHEAIYTENETNKEGLKWGENASRYVKDAFEYYVMKGQKEVVNPNQSGTKAAAYYVLDIGAGETRVVRLRLREKSELPDPFGGEFATVLQDRKREADEFYQAVAPAPLSDEMRNVQRQAFAGLLWNKQFYYYVVRDWLNGDPTSYPPPEQRKITGRNHNWQHLYSEDILSMPDTWEYPWFASWDLAFHTLPLALIDPAFAKQQLWLLTRSWYMDPDGQIPGYEWNFSDLNPPIQAWAAWRIYKIEEKMYGRGDREALEQVFQALTLYFTWWLNREDAEDNNIFQGGFLGLDNISPLDRSHIPPESNSYIDQSDGTAWLAMFCLDMLRIASELAIYDPTYKEMASRFFLHFLHIADAMNDVGGGEEDFWNDEDGFYYDILHLTNGRRMDGKQFVPIKLRSVVGLVPLFATHAISQEFLQLPEMKDLKHRFEWFLHRYPELVTQDNIVLQDISEGSVQGKLLALVSPEKLKRILARVLDEDEFLSPHGIRSLSKFYEQHPYTLDGHQIAYVPGDAKTRDFGGNSNWRGPVWFPINFLIIESLQRFHRFLGDGFKVEFPTRSGTLMTLGEVATELSNRLIQLFLRDSAGNRPMYGNAETFQKDPHWQDLLLFYEYFHGDNGRGLGASHQTGWTGMVANLIQQSGEHSPD